MKLKYTLLFLYCCLMAMPVFKLFSFLLAVVPWIVVRFSPKLSKSIPVLGHEHFRWVAKTGLITCVTLLIVLILYYMGYRQVERTNGDTLGYTLLLLSSLGTLGVFIFAYSRLIIGMFRLIFDFPPMGFAGLLRITSDRLRAPKDDNDKTKTLLKTRL